MEHKKWTLVKFAILVFGLGMIVMGAQGAFFPRPGAEASIVSFIAGGGMGAIALGMLALSFSKPRIAYIVTSVICLLAIGRFAGSVYGPDKVPKGKTFADLTPAQQEPKLHVYPALVTVLLGAGTLVVLFSGHLSAMRARKASEIESAEQG